MNFFPQDAKCSLCVGLISLAVVAALVLERLVSGRNAVRSVPYQSVLKDAVLLKVSG